MSDIERRETMWFTMQPDCYGGPQFDQVEPRWHCYADGDKDSDEQREALELDPSRFPPGTQIIVKEPVCPVCKELRLPSTSDGEVKFDAKCECGFDWEAWTLHQYS